MNICIDKINNCLTLVEKVNRPYSVRYVTKSAQLTFSYRPATAKVRFRSSISDVWRGGWLEAIPIPASCAGLNKTSCAWQSELRNIKSKKS